MLHEISQTQKATYCGIPFIWPSGLKGKSIRAGKIKNTQWLPRAGDGEGDWLQRDKKKHSEVMGGIFFILSEAVKWLHICQTHRTAHLQWVTFSVYNRISINLTWRNLRAKLRSVNQKSSPLTHTLKIEKVKDEQRKREIYVIQYSYPQHIKTSLKAKSAS